MRWTDRPPRLSEPVSIQFFLDLTEGCPLLHEPVPVPGLIEYPDLDLLYPADPENFPPDLV